MIVTGSLESNDCMITLTPATSFSVYLESVVKDAYGAHIEALIETICQAHGLKHYSVRCQDQGALDATIEARLHEAIARVQADA